MHYQFLRFLTLLLCLICIHKANAARTQLLSSPLYLHAAEEIANCDSCHVTTVTFYKNGTVQGFESSAQVLISLSSPQSSFVAASAKPSWEINTGGPLRWMRNASDKPVPVSEIFSPFILRNDVLYYTLFVEKEGGKGMAALPLVNLRVVPRGALDVGGFHMITDSHVSVVVGGDTTLLVRKDVDIHVWANSNSDEEDELNDEWYLRVGQLRALPFSDTVLNLCSNNTGAERCWRDVEQRCHSTEGRIMLDSKHCWKMPLQLQRACELLASKEQGLAEKNNEIGGIRVLWRHGICERSNGECDGETLSFRLVHGPSFSVEISGVKSALPFITKESDDSRDSTANLGEFDKYIESARPGYHMKNEDESSRYLDGVDVCAHRDNGEIAAGHLSNTLRGTFLKIMDNLIHSPTVLESLSDQDIALFFRNYSRLVCHARDLTQVAETFKAGKNITNLRQLGTRPEQYDFNRAVNGVSSSLLPVATKLSDSEKALQPTTLTTNLSALSSLVPQESELITKGAYMFIAVHLGIAIIVLAVLTFTLLQLEAVHEIWDDNSALKEQLRLQSSPENWSNASSTSGMEMEVCDIADREEFRNELTGGLIRATTVDAAVATLKREGDSVDSYSKGILSQFLTQYKIEGRIGAGAEGAVFRVHHLVTNAHFAVKIVILDERDEDHRLREVVLHSTFDDANVARYCHCWIEALPMSTIIRMCMLPELAMEGPTRSESVASLPVKNRSLLFGGGRRNHHQNGGLPSLSSQFSVEDSEEEGCNSIRESKTGGVSFLDAADTLGSSAGITPLANCSPTAELPENKNYPLRSAFDRENNKIENKNEIVRVLFIQMVCYEGGTLREYLKYRPRKCYELGIRTSLVNCKLLHGIASGLKFLHDRGVVQRDVKPSNIFIGNTPLILAAAEKHWERFRSETAESSESGEKSPTLPCCPPLLATLSDEELHRFYVTEEPPEAKIGDFGHSLTVSGRPLSEMLTNNAQQDQQESYLASLLQTAEFCVSGFREKSSSLISNMSYCYGTPPYACPEQLEDRKPHPAMDIYSLGIIGLELSLFFATDSERLITLQSVFDHGVIPASLCDEDRPEFALFARMVQRGLENRPRIGTVVKEFARIIRIQEEAIRDI